MAKEGFPGIYVLMELRRNDRNKLRTMKSLGVDIAYAYTWGTPDAGRQRDNNLALRSSATAEGLGWLPSISMGWDVQAWGAQTGGWLPPADFKTLSSWTRNEFMPGFPAGSLGRRMIMLANWNEFGEGHFLMPATLAGFGYLDALREVFGGGGAHDDARPTEKQKRRFTVLYPRD